MRHMFKVNTLRVFCSIPNPPRYPEVIVGPVSDNSSSRQTVKMESGMASQLSKLVARRLDVPVDRPLAKCALWTVHAGKAGYGALEAHVFVRHVFQLGL